VASLGADLVALDRGLPTVLHVHSARFTGNPLWRRRAHDAGRRHECDRRDTMHARAVDDAADELRKLRATEREDLGLALVVLAASLVATDAAPSLALPFFLGAVGVAVLGLRAAIRRFDLVQQLWGDRDAYAIHEVRERAEREATMARRRSSAARIRAVVEVEADLKALVAELEDSRLALDPAAAVLCAQLQTDAVESPLLCPEKPVDELRARVRRARAGFASIR
jgi:hypothetical protein